MLDRNANDGLRRTERGPAAAASLLTWDRAALGAIVAAAYALALVGNSFLLQAVMIPFLVFSLAAIGLNILTGYAGLLSLGTGAFMGVGAYACYKLTTIFPHINIIVWILASGLFSAAIGVLFGLPSFRIKGFYLAVATLAAQFFLQWAFNRIPWLYNYNLSGAIEAPLRTLFSVPITGATATPQVRYLVVLTLVIVLTWLASNLVRGRIGRMWMAIRDMDIAAELIGVKIFESKILAFAVSSYYCGVSGAMLVFLWYATGAEHHAFEIGQSFLILAMIIIGGLGTLLGAFLGAALIYMLPIALGVMLPPLLSLIDVRIQSDVIEHLRFMVVGALVVAFLIYEPLGLARLLQIARLRLQQWLQAPGRAQPPGQNVPYAAARIGQAETVGSEHLATRRDQQ